MLEIRGQDFLTEKFLSQMKQPDKPKFIENTLLLVLGLIALAPLSYQLPRWVRGVDPTIVPASLVEHSSLPFVLHMAAVHPLFWLGLTLWSFWRLCRNYGWRLVWGI